MENKTDKKNILFITLGQNDIQIVYKDKDKDYRTSIRKNKEYDYENLELRYDFDKIEENRPQNRNKDKNENKDIVPIGITFPIIFKTFNKIKDKKIDAIYLFYTNRTKWKQIISQNQKNTDNDPWKALKKLIEREPNNIIDILNIYINDILKQYFDKKIILSAFNIIDFYNLDILKKYDNDNDKLFLLDLSNEIICMEMFDKIFNEIRKQDKFKYEDDVFYSISGGIPPINNAMKSFIYSYFKNSFNVSASELLDYSDISQNLKLEAKQKYDEIHYFYKMRNDFIEEISNYNFKYICNFYNKYLKKSKVKFKNLYNACMSINDILVGSKNEYLKKSNKKNRYKTYINNNDKVLSENTIKKIDSSSKNGISKNLIRIYFSKNKLKDLEYNIPNIFLNICNLLESLAKHSINKYLNKAIVKKKNIPTLDYKYLKTKYNIIISKDTIINIISYQNIFCNINNSNLKNDSIASLNDIINIYNNKKTSLRTIRNKYLHNEMLMPKNEVKAFINKFLNSKLYKILTDESANNIFFDKPINYGWIEDAKNELLNYLNNLSFYDHS